MYIERKRLLRHLREPALAGETHEHATALSLLPSVRTGARIKQRQLTTHSGACRMISKAMYPPIDKPASASRGGAVDRICLAISRLSARRWSVTVTGPNCHSAGICSEKRRAVQVRPRISSRGKLSVIKFSFCPIMSSGPPRTDSSPHALSHRPKLPIQISPVLDHEGLSSAHSPFFSSSSVCSRFGHSQPLGTGRTDV
jgi:hypothetical protein